MEAKKEKKSVLIATPTREGLFTNGYLQGVSQVLTDEELLKEYRFQVLTTTGVSNIVKGRDDIFNFWLNDSVFDFLLWVDSDTSFTSENVKASLDLGVGACTIAQARKEINKELVCKIARSTNLDANEVFESSYRYTMSNVTSKDGVSFVDRCGFGFLLLKRSSCEHMASVFTGALPTYKNGLTGKKSVSYHSLMIEKEEVISEDFSFCKRLTSSGTPIRLIEKHGVGHSGQYEWGSNIVRKMDMVLNGFK